MQQSVTGLNKALKEIKGSLKNPNLSIQARNEIESSIDKGQSTLDQMTDALEGKL